ncbi:hypothetical protein, partial [Streptomyces sp. ADI96-02]|uniref:hypothetical protein n=1 Tax=Streptomyces sp. ADI96-02 TaxID=1522760 RepID=UPI0013DE17D7
VGVKKTPGAIAFAKDRIIKSRKVAPAPAPASDPVPEVTKELPRGEPWRPAKDPLDMEWHESVKGDLESAEMRKSISSKMDDWMENTADPYEDWNKSVIGDDPLSLPLSRNQAARPDKASPSQPLLLHPNQRLPWGVDNSPGSGSFTGQKANLVLINKPPVYTGQKISKSELEQITSAMHYDQASVFSYFL